MSELVTVSLKMSPEFRDRLKAAGELSGRSVSALLLEGASIVVARLDGGLSPSIIPEVEASELHGPQPRQPGWLTEALTAGLAEWRSRAEGAEKANGSRIGPASVLPPPTALVKRLVDSSRHHPAGDILASAVPDVAGETVGFNLKGHDKPRSKPK